MPSTVYLNSRRTLVASWRNDANGAILSSYDEFAPTADLDTIAGQIAIDTVVVSSESWFVHTYPSSPHLDAFERQEFELSQICGFDAHEPPVLDRHCTLRISDNLMWTSIIGVPHAALQETRSRFGAHCAVVSDLEADICMALLSIPKQEFPWLLYGRRGNIEISVIIGEQHTPQHISIRSAADGAITAEHITLELSLVHSRFHRQVRHVVVFGDHITANAIDDLRRELRRSDIRCARLQPFRLVSSDLESDASRRVISRAHVIAPLMYSVRDLVRG